MITMQPQHVMKKAGGGRQKGYGVGAGGGGTMRAGGEENKVSGLVKTHAAINKN